MANWQGITKDDYLRCRANLFAPYPDNAMCWGAVWGRVFTTMSGNSSADMKHGFLSLGEEWSADGNTVSKIIRRTRNKSWFTQNILDTDPTETVNIKKGFTIKPGSLSLRCTSLPVSTDWSMRAFVVLDSMVQYVARVPYELSNGTIAYYDMMWPVSNPYIQCLGYDRDYLLKTGLYMYMFAITRGLVSFTHEAKPVGGAPYSFNLSWGDSSELVTSQSVYAVSIASENLANWNASNSIKNIEAIFVPQRGTYG